MAKKNIILSLCITSLIVSAHTHAQNASQPLDEVIAIGSRDAVEKITGSAYFIDAATLDKFEYSDIQRISREVPGVSIQVEDGYGLRPNISIRGVATERSGRITLLEDNVLIAPAPYSAPSAYYFPTAGRMQSFEVLKGPSAITQGPYTIGGALNMVSTPISQREDGKVLFEIGTDATARLHATYSATNDAGFGYLLEAHQWQSDGFQNIDRSATNTGLDVTDYTVKLAYAPNNSAHSIEVKFQKADQNSNQSYLGLSDADFRNNAYRRYALSELDNIDTAHEQVILRYAFQLSDNLKLTSTAYNNTHQRNWFKTEGIDLDGSADAESFTRTSWAKVIDAVNQDSSLSAGDINFNSDQLNAILAGTLDTAVGSIQLRSNAREYYSRGLQFNLGWTTTIGNTSHQIDAGVRYHEDQEDRLQRNSTYQQLNGELVLNDLGTLGNAGNRIQEAQAIAVHIQDSIEFGNWVFTPGLRYEDIDQSRTRFRDGAARSFRDSRANKTSVLLPGLGAIYKINEALSLVGGIHKGFTAPSNSPNVREETAINSELGIRYHRDNTRVELMAFISDYDNLLGECTASSGSGCEIGDAFNGEAATVQGLEALFSTSTELNNAMHLNSQFSFTYTDSQFDTNIADTDFFGDVSAGDPIPYIPKSQFQFLLGLERDIWQVNANVSYVDEVCSRASCDKFERTDDALTLDLAGQYLVNGNLKLYARIENVSDEQDILGRQPYGARPNKGRSSSVGVELNF